MPAATSMPRRRGRSVQRFEGRRPAAIEGGAAHQAILLDELEVLGTRHQSLRAAIHQALGDAAVAVAEATRARRLGDDPDLAAVMLGRDPPRAVVAADDAGFAQERRFRGGGHALLEHERCQRAV